ncbi:iron donor protein CyaY [Motiliproteus sp. MSK22-1]|uniref:iron donor protein CyaY n=1 Tax=Motiliproteus sp. MSK22-1 TaxID=1897630 RepID=UPI000976DC23|nr:iron donor protein CyaY [Motiliproteus sp. MSK22-1]OMH39581.1 iron donor protein CyaY [Motiliproteus sp. MSK22-1]
MNESEFNVLVDDTLLSIEETLDDAETDLDLMNVGGVLTVQCENGVQVIFTRQAAVSQLWIASPDGGFHFDYHKNEESGGGQWRRDSDSEPLELFLQRVFAEHAGESFQFAL